jgi:hypothetical protein
MVERSRFAGTWHLRDACARRTRDERDCSRGRGFDFKEQFIDREFLGKRQDLTPFPVAPYAGSAPAGGCPVSEQLAASVLSLPMSADLQADDQLRVVQALGAALESVPAAA